jgi:ABC-type glycerol-3-phosphate transport system substrate-binding protein
VISYIVFNNANTEAGKAWIEYALTEHYATLSQALNPGHYNPAFAGFRDSDEYATALENEFDDRGWDVDMETVQRYQQGTVVPRIFETDPPNPVGGATYEGDPLVNMVQETIVNDLDAEEAIDKYASQHQALIDENQ